MVRRNGSAKNVLRNTQFNLIGKLIAKFAEQENTNVIVAPFFPGKYINYTYLSPLQSLRAIESDIEKICIF
jgi:hypothetical protein